MNKLIQILLITSLAFSINAQTIDTIYQDHLREKVTKEVYEELQYDEAVIPAYYTEGNTFIKYVIFDYDRTVIDQMPVEKVNELREYLSSLTGKRFHENKTLVIDYYPGEDRSNKYINTKHQAGQFINYNKALSKMPHVNQVCIRKKGSDLGKWNGTANWVEDADKYIEKNYFPHHYLHGSMMMIKPDGSYVKRYGKYELERSFKELTIFSPLTKPKKPVQAELPRM